MKKNTKTHTQNNEMMKSRNKTQIIKKLKGKKNSSISKPDGNLCHCFYHPH